MDVKSSENSVQLKDVEFARLKDLYNSKKEQEQK